MVDIYILLGVCIIIWYFYFLRKVAERARALTEQYCEQNGIQFIAIARSKTSLGASKRLGIYLRSTFEFEFSGDGESSYTGTLTMNGVKPNNFDTPPYKT